MPPPIDKTSDILQEVIAYPTGEDRISIGEFIHMLGDRGFCLAILVFSLPNSLPVPGIPGFSTITGLPITLIALQMILGRNVLWMPKKVAAKTFSRQGLSKLLAKALPAVVWLEKYLKPRWLFVTSPTGERVLGLWFAILSLIIALPIPGGNFLPGLSMSLLALGLLARDGVFLLAVMGFCTFTVVFMTEIIMLFFKALAKGFSKLF